MPKKKSKKEEVLEETPPKEIKTKSKTSKKTTSKSKKTEDNKEGKGRLVVSQHEKDEIDAVIDAFWSFITLLKKAPKHLVAAGFIIALIGASAIFANLHLNVLATLMGIAMVLFSIFTIIPGIAVTFRRLHDTNRSGWFLLLFFIPVIGSLVLLITFCLKSTPGANQYGPHPYGLSDTKKEGP